MKEKDPIIYGMCGFAKAGKNYVADQLQKYLREKHDILAPQVSFAQPLKDLTHKLYPDLSTDKSNMEVREAYQSVGSLLRYHIAPTVFIEAMQELIFSDESTEQQYFIITDVRYMNEIQWILNGNEKNQIIHITRTGISPANMHQSELDHLQIKLTDNVYYRPRITSYKNEDGSDPTKIFKKIIKV
jgi:pantothenate kinase